MADREQEAWCNQLLGEEAEEPEESDVCNKAAKYYWTAGEQGYICQDCYDAMVIDDVINPGEVAELRRARGGGS